MNGAAASEVAISIIREADADDESDDDETATPDYRSLIQSVLLIYYSLHY